MHEDIIAHLGKNGEARGLEIPPQVFLDMEGEIINYAPQTSLTIRFPVKKRYQNPLGQMQGGMIVAAIDNVFGPLSYLAGPPSGTTQLNTSFIRSVTPEDEYIEVTAQVDEITRRHVYMSARVKNAKDETVAISQTSFTILRVPRK